MTVPAFSPADLAETAARIRQRLDGDEETLALLQQLLDATEQNSEAWDERLMALQQSQKAVLKAVAFLMKQSQSQGRRLETITKGLAATFNLVKSRSTVVSKSMLGKGQGAILQHDSGGRSLEETSRLGLLSKAIINTLGPRGGHSYPYNPGLASRMMLAGTLTARQHKTWKASNRLHDDPWQHLQGRRAG